LSFEGNAVFDLAVPAWDMTVHFINATVQIDQPLGDGTRTVGTGFLLQAPRADGSPRVVLVTAAHVLDRMPHNEMRVGWRFAQADGSWQYSPAQVRIRDNGLALWTQHPERDIAVMEVSAPEPFAGAALPLGWLADEHTFERAQVGPGDEVMALGYPRGLSANRAGFPILRSGRIASYPLSPIEAFPTFLIDFTVFPGNSGGPVFFTAGTRRRDGRTELAHPFIAGIITRQVELNAERLEIGVVAHALYVREAVALLDQAQAWQGAYSGD
jgi:S1-C subfamily serine protease